MCLFAAADPFTSLFSFFFRGLFLAAVVLRLRVVVAFFLTRRFLVVLFFRPAVASSALVAIVMRVSGLDSCGAEFRLQMLSPGLRFCPALSFLSVLPCLRYSAGACD